MKKEKRKFSKRGKFGSAALISALVIGIMFGYMTLPHPQLVNDEKGWHIIFDGNLAQAAENNPGAGASGILQLFFPNHSADPGNAYDENTSATIEGWCTANMPGKTPYSSSDDFNLELDHTTTFDFIIKVRVNKTHAWNGTAFIDAWVRVNWTSADLGIGADTGMTGVILTNDSSDNYIWMMFYDTNGGSGFSLSKDQSADITSIKLEVYY
jgi:hypothetical protein